MLARAVCLSILTTTTILSIRPPASSNTKEKADKIKDEGYFSVFMIKLMPQFGQMAAILATAFYISLMAAGVISDKLETWQVVATVFGVCGYLLRTWAFRTLDRFFTDGPYTYLLHPSYTGLMMTGLPYVFYLAHEGYWNAVIEPLMLIPIPEPLLVIGGVLLSAGLAAYRVRGEEEMLSQHFGSEWKEYASRRWRFIPLVI